MTPFGLERSFSDFVGRNRLISPSDRLFAAVSGGVDSMVMLRLLCVLRDGLPFDLCVAHVNHGLRGAESDADEEFVRQAAAGLGVEFHLHRSVTALDPLGGAPGLQERARDDRYRFFDSLRAASPGPSRVATAHHRDDNAETVLFNFLRGSGVHGLGGIPVMRTDGSVIRPLLFASREEIRRYAADRSLPFREDSSNAAPKYTRNALRLSVIPSIEALVNPGLRETLSRTSAIFTGLESYIGREVGKILPEIVTGETAGEVRLHAGRLAALPPFLAESLLMAVSRRFSPYGIGYTHVRTLIGLLGSQPGSSCDLPNNLRASREHDHLVLRIGRAGGGTFSFPVSPGEAYDFGEFAFSSRIAAGAAPGSDRREEYVDADRLGGDLRLRNWEDGDWFVPFGMRARKKLSDFFTDRKIPAGRKRRIPILVCGADIVWVCGERLDDRFRIGPGTRRILLLRYEPAPH